MSIRLVYCCPVEMSKPDRTTPILQSNPTVGGRAGAVVAGAAVGLLGRPVEDGPVVAATLEEGEAIVDEI